MPGIKGDGMRGLAVFISDIRNCKSKEAEVKRINKELANIRSKFKGETVLDGYSKKKYICKLLFIFLLGHDVDFGYMEAVNLLTSNKYSEKHIGYLFVSVMLPQNSDLFKLIIHNIRSDLLSQNPIFENLALQCIANICNTEMAEEFAELVGKLLIAGVTNDMIKQSASLALLKILRTYPETVQRNPSFLSRLMQLVNSNHLGVVTSATSLLDCLAKQSPHQFRPLIPLSINRLHRLINANFNNYQDYLYYFIPAPWLCVALMKLLQNFPVIHDAVDKTKLNDCLETILSCNQEPPKSKKIQHTNARYAVFFEAVNLCIHLDNDQNLLVRCANQLGHFLEHRETNLRYLALESICLLATSDHAREAVKTHRNLVVKSLQTEKDLTVRRKAIEVLYAICDKTNVKFVVGQLLEYLTNCDYQLKEEMALKISILSERYTVDYNWYIDVMLKLIRLAGDFVADEVWHRVIQVVSSHDEIQSYAAKTCFEYLQMEPVHDAMVKVAGYVLGEFGNFIAGDARSSARVQLALLQSRFTASSQATRCLLLSTYMKFVNLYPELKPDIENIFGSDINLRNADVENQQRALEYLTMLEKCSTETLATILDVIPAFDAKHECQKTNSAAQQKNERLLIDESLSIIPQSSLPTTQMDSADNCDERKIEPPHNAIKSNKLFERFSFRNFGILFEDSQIQIGFKDEYSGSQGTLYLYVGNKSKQTIQNASLEILGEVINVEDTEGKGSAAAVDTHWLVPFPETIEPGQQLMCSLALGLVSAFSELISARLTCEWVTTPGKKSAGLKHGLTFQLPIFLNKFFDSAAMNASAFAARWNHLNRPDQQFELDTNGTIESVQKLLKSFGWSVLKVANEQTNSESVCGAALVTFQHKNRVGLLYCIQTNTSPAITTLKLRCIRPEIGQIVSKLLATAFNCM